MNDVNGSILKDFSEDIIAYICGFLGPSQVCLGECQGFPPRESISDWDINREKTLVIEETYYESIEMYISLAKIGGISFLLKLVESPSKHRLNSINSRLITMRT